jgi:hypothetical protein
MNASSSIARRRRHALQLSIVLAALDFSTAFAQTKDWPFPPRSPVAANASAIPVPASIANSTPPPPGMPMRQLTWETIANREVSLLGAEALSVNPRAWYHGETENFIVHYRLFSDALQVAREIEFDLWYVAKTLGATKEQYARKSHVYTFGDDKEWRAFLIQAQHREQWAHSFAHGDELFLNVHGTGHGFESDTLAHETTHTVVARIYGRRQWPIWLNEGFAEYMANCIVSARRGLTPGANPRTLSSATLSVIDLFALTEYPADRGDVERLYDTGAKFVRYLFSAYPRERFPQFVDRLLSGEPTQAALIEIYGNEFRDMSSFERRFRSSIR